MKSKLKYSIIEINGEEKGFFFGLLSLHLFFKEQGENPKNVQKALQEKLSTIAPIDEETGEATIDIVSGFQILVDLLYTMHRAYCAIEKEKPSEKWEVYSWVDILGIEGIQALLPTEEEQPSKTSKKK